ncbi:MAG: hypothetical protein GX175_05325 [Halanaerobiaceae bacterium]|nr:hypothetical protein [Halanaerobiaceae bacterium]
MHNERYDYCGYDISIWSDPDAVEPVEAVKSKRPEGFFEVCNWKPGSESDRERTEIDIRQAETLGGGMNA